MRGHKRQVNVVLALRQFRNINLSSKGCYKLKIQAFSPKKHMNLGYYYNEDLQQNKHQLKNNFSTNAECYSDEQKLSPTKSTAKSFTSDLSCKNQFFTVPFYIKYHCQRIKIKSVSFFTQTMDHNFVQIRLTLFRKASKNAGFAHFQSFQSVQFSLNCQNHFLEQKQILMVNPECCSFKMTILSCPIIFYEDIYDLSLQVVKTQKIKKIDQRNAIILSQIRKMVKKQRYEAFILRKQLNDIMKVASSDSIKLPLHFVQKQMISMDEVQTSQILFFKYLAFYERYHISADMLKEQMEHINFDKITTLKSFIDSFQKDQVIFTTLEEKEQYLLQKKLKHYIVQSSSFLCGQKLLDKYSQNELKSKKQKVRQLDKCIYSGNYCLQNVFEGPFCFQKQNKKNVSGKDTIVYPIIFRDVFLFRKQNIVKAQNMISALMHKKVRRKKKYFILAHGFQGLPIDLSYLINLIKLSSDRIKIVLLNSYKNHMAESIEVMAQKVSKEIKIFFQNIDLKQIQPQITFIGHSMGPIILRAALKQLASYHQYFQTFVSICSPHLGYIQGTKFLTDKGLSILAMLKPVQSLSQLSNRDNVDLQKTFIYRLSKQGSLSCFKNIILIACMDDGYVPWHSARIQPFAFEGPKEKIQKQMISNILGLKQMHNKIQKIQRIQINFRHQKQKSINSFIGRTCHIKPLNDRGFLQILTREILPN